MADAMSRARAVRARPAVEQGLAGQARALAAQAGALAGAEEALRTAAERLGALGTGPLRPYAEAVALFAS